MGSETKKMLVKLCQIRDGVRISILPLAPWVSVRAYGTRIRQPRATVAVGYPQRTWKTGITNSWMVDFFIMSCAPALLLKNVIKVTF